MRRYVLGRQGLWPGRRVADKPGVAQIIRQIGAVQIDPINVVARSHDIVLWGRVAGYQPSQLDELLYSDRQFFDYGGGLEVYPIEELPYWRVHMRRKALEPRWATFAAQNPALLEEVRQELRARGPLGNRDFTGRASVQNYRARKDSGLALYYLWLTGELMTHHRRNFERVYGFREQVAPAALAQAATEEQAEDFFARKALGGMGLRTAREWAAGFAGLIERKVDRDEAQRRLDALVAAGEVAAVRVEGRKDICYFTSPIVRQN